MGIILNSSAKSHRDWKATIEVVDDDTDELLDLTGAIAAIAVEDSDGCQRILATTDNGKLSVVGLGTIDLFVPYTEMNLLPGSYNIGGYLQLNGGTDDLFEGTLTLRRGIPKP